MLMPSGVYLNTNISSNSSKVIYGTLWSNYGKGGEESSKSWAAGFNLTAKPGKSFSVTLSPSYNKNMDLLQYVTETSFNGEARYILGRIDQQIVRLSLRLNYNITPDLSHPVLGAAFPGSDGLQ